MSKLPCGSTKTCWHGSALRAKGIRHLSTLSCGAITSISDFMPVGVKSLMLVIAPQDSVDKCLIPFALSAEPCQHVFVEPQGNLLIRLRKLYSHVVLPPR